MGIDVKQAALVAGHVVGVFGGAAVAEEAPDQDAGQAVLRAAGCNVIKLGQVVFRAVMSGSVPAGVTLPVPWTITVSPKTSPISFQAYSRPQ